jgi:hypothetical protein
MKRINVIYDGMPYSIGQKDLDELKAVIEEAAATGQPRWVQVNQGEGSPRTAELFISGSPAIALIMEPSEDEAAD